MSNIPFLVPERDLGVRISRILIILKVLGINRSGNPILTSEKITIFDFLAKYPFILKEILSHQNKGKDFKLYDTEIGSIHSQYPNSLSLFEYGNTNGYLNLLTAYGYVCKTNKGNHIYFNLTDEGIKLTELIETPYISRLEEICKSMSSVKNYTTSRLIKRITPFVQGV